jgi:lysophospholipase L1-like esterase
MTRLLVVGDSFTSSISTTDHPMWPEILGGRLGVDVDNRAVGGAGHVTQSKWYPWPTRFVRQVVQRPTPPADVVVVFGSCNDRGQTEYDVRAGAGDTFYAVRAAHPGAALIVVGPQWHAGVVDPALRPVQIQVEGVAGEVGVDYYADPVGNRWLAGRYDLIGPDEFHPNAAGQVHLADIMAEIVRPFLP